MINCLRAPYVFVLLDCIQQQKCILLAFSLKTKAFILCKKENRYIIRESNWCCV